MNKYRVYDERTNNTLFESECFHDCERYLDGNYDEYIWIQKVK